MEKELVHFDKYIVAEDALGFDEKEDETDG